MKLIRFIVFVFAILFSHGAFATHNRAGEITYKWIGVNQTDYTYEITIITYTKTSSYPAVDRPRLDTVHLGDGAVVSFPRTSTAPVQLGNDISYNEYKYTHTYNGNGTFTIYFIDPNRNEGVVNIPSSVDVPFAVSSELVINPYLGPNSSPILTYPPIDKGCVGRIFIHNPNAFDPEGDSLVYEMQVCNGDANLPIPGYSYPSTSNTFGIDLHTGDLIWDSPVDTGEYNVAFIVKQYKQGLYAGFVRRDMQILIGNCTNHPPDLSVVSDTCVLAGDTLNIVVGAIDPDHNLVDLTAFGAMFDTNFVTNKATFTIIQNNNDTVSSLFSWSTDCNEVRSSPYVALFKARDAFPSNTNTSLVSLQTTNIRVIAPAPASLSAVASGSGIDLNWSISPCGQAIGYNIYGRINPYNGVIQCPCDNGAPSYTGYTLLDTVRNVNTLNYRDDNNGAGLVIGEQYCYLITAVFADGSESCSSPQACASLKKDLPVLTNADVRVTDPVNGSVYVAWSRPNELDTIQYPGPYLYAVYHSPDFFGSNFASCGTNLTLNDTTFIDTINLDTKTHAWSYKIDFYYTSGGSFVLKGSSTIASTVFLTLTPTDNRVNLSWEEHVPWVNSEYTIYKLNPATTLYDSLTTITGTSYADTALVNGTQYCYYVKSIGSYSLPGIASPLENRSQRDCASPTDNVPPCATALDVQSDCDANANLLTWVNPNHVCTDDVLKYYIYYSPGNDGNFELIDSVLNANDTVYLHSNLEVIAGCYKVISIDSVGNQTVNPVEVCVDTCRQYVLPSVFTPNSDGMNDIFHPCDATTSSELQQTNCPPYKNVKSVDMKIYNRWGNLVFETTDRDIKWDGKNKDSKGDCPEGVYYYTCKVYFFRITGDEAVELHGTVQLIRGN